MMKRTRLALAITAALVMAGGIAAAGTGARAGAAVRGAAAVRAAGQVSVPAGDSPPGFYYGTDSWPVTITGSAPYQVPHVGGNYGGYIGMTGSWSYWLGCRGGFLAWAPANSQQANVNYARGIGIGTGVYWFMGGPGVDPHYNGTAQRGVRLGASGRRCARWPTPNGQAVNVPGHVHRRRAARGRPGAPTTAGTASTPHRAAAG